ncbi:MAG: hypothetical protein A2083_10665 [Gemmatimonadetes bacterium GWC2_71_9]|nr:MAG: hypothetical protein A2083_10665 [Gemmatimonadetes bacterium GWC2_71_9]
MVRGIAMHSAPPRWSPGYSLDEAARIRKQIVMRAGPMGCPHCGAELKPTVGGDGERRVWLVRCEQCRRGVVVHNGG